MTESEWAVCDDPQRMLRFVMQMSANPDRPLYPYRPSDRKLRLFACACCRMVWHLLTDAQKVSVVFAESEPWHQAASGSVHPEYLSQHAITDYTGSIGQGRCIQNAVRWLNAASAREVADQSPAWLQRLMPFQTQANILRCIVGNPFRPVTIDPAWLTPDVVSLARAAYEERETKLEQCPHCRKPGRYCGECHGTTKRLVCTGRLDPERLAVLADALEEAGCVRRACLSCVVAVARGAPNPDGLRCGCVESDILAHLRSPGPHWRGCHVIDALTGRE